MKRSQLFLCWTFTRLHVTKYLAFCLLLTPSIQLCYQLKALCANGSNPTGLPCPAPERIWTWHWGLVKSQCLCKLTDTKRQLCLELSQELQASARATTSPPSTCVVSSCHCDTVATEPQGVCQPIFFKSFLSAIALLTNVLGQIRTFPRMSLH